MKQHVQVMLTKWEWIELLNLDTWMEYYYFP